MIPLINAFRSLCKRLKKKLHNVGLTRITSHIELVTDIYKDYDFGNQDLHQEKLIAMTICVCYSLLTTSIINY